MLLTSLICFSAISFLWYGLNCLINKKMRQEFERFGLGKFRILTGILQTLGAIGLFMGLFFPLLTLIASAGLALLMLIGVFVRIKIKDHIIVALPAFALMLLNSYIFFTAYQSYQ
ncbi:MAG: DoxX family protein [Maribacter sp.]|nr:DoxX family protein [Maribacter sp.]